MKWEKIYIFLQYKKFLDNDCLMLPTIATCIGYSSTARLAQKQTNKKIQTKKYKQIKNKTKCFYDTSVIETFRNIRKNISEVKIYIFNFLIGFVNVIGTDITVLCRHELTKKKKKRFKSLNHRKRAEKGKYYRSGIEIHNIGY